MTDIFPSPRASCAEDLPVNAIAAIYLVDVPSRSLAEVIRSLVVARDPTGVDQVGASVHLILNVGSIHRLVQGMVDRLHMDILELDARTRVHGRAIEHGGNVVSRGAVDVGPGDIFNRHLGRVAELTASLRVDALRELHRQGDIHHLEVVEGHILDQTAAAAAGVAIAARRGGDTSPGLDVCAVDAVQTFHVFEAHVLHVVRRGGILTQRSDGHAPIRVTCDILDEQVGGVSFDCDAVIAVVDDRVLDEEVVAVPRVVAVRVDCAPLIVTGGIDVQLAELS